MARSITYWYDIIDAEKRTMSNLTGLQPNVNSSQLLLSDVTTKSRVARWRLWMWCVAVCCYSMDVLFDLFKIDLANIAQQSRYGTIPWYVAISKEYQLGYNLVWVDNSYQYSIVDTASQIVKLAAAVEIITTTSSVVILKVAKLSGTIPAKLDSGEKVAFAAYIKKRKAAGIVVNVISEDADDLRLYVDVDYDPLVLKATGESILTPGIFPVEDAINLFLQNLSIYNFNGVLDLDTLTDIMQSVYGVLHAYVTKAMARYGANPFVQFTENYQSNAGYLAIDAGTPLSGSINYINNV